MLLAGAMVFFSGTLSAQGRLILHNNAYLVIAQDAYVVLDNPAPDALTTTGTGGNVVTEREFNRVKWNIGANTGTYILPFTTTSGSKIPFTLTVGTAGTGTGHLLFSTYSGPDWNNDTYRPSDVTHMLDYASGLINNSARAMDRFWIIEAADYSTRPTVNLTFTYVDNDFTAPGNSIAEGNLGAQRFNSATSQWGDYLPQGTPNTGAKTVGSITAGGADFFRSWTLVDNASPLPVELLSFTAECDDVTGVRLKWVTASESQNLRFVLEKSTDASAFYEIVSLPGAGNSNSLSEYTWHDPVFSGLAYYRLVQEDIGGLRKTYTPVAADCEQASLFSAFAYMAGGEIQLEMQLPESGAFQWRLTDMSGRMLYRAQKNYVSGTSSDRLNPGFLPAGIYLLSFEGERHRYVQKLVIP